MSFLQSARFRISGRIATRRRIGKTLHVGLRVDRRQADADAPLGWSIGRSDHFDLVIAEQHMQDYVETLGADDLVIVEGELVSTAMASGAKSGPMNSVRFQVGFLAALPRSVADRIDQETAPGLPKASPAPPF